MVAKREAARERLQLLADGLTIGIYSSLSQKSMADIIKQ